MGQWIEKYRAEAEEILKKDGVRDVCFAGPTYQVEVFDEQVQKSYWPFLQFEKKGALKDAFCSCEHENGCPHLAAAYLKIFGNLQEPIHTRFPSSLWNALFRQCSDHFGYETKVIQNLEDGHFIAENEMSFSIQAKTSKTKRYLTNLIESRPKETPENSIKFSDLPIEEIEWWKEGRPSPSLRFTLSFWADLAKWALLLQEEAAYQLYFEEGEEGFPTKLTASWKELEIKFSYGKEDLIKLIPSLVYVNSPLSVSQESLGDIEKIEYDPKRKCFNIQHAKVKQKSGEKRELDGWIYRPADGFYAKGGSGFFDRDLIPTEEVALALSDYQKELEGSVSIGQKRLFVNYKMYFDQNWEWHFEGYLFEPGDLQKADAALFDGWAYLDGKGFFPVEEPLFENHSAVVASDDLSRFLNHHRIWLNSQEGFQTHLANIESHIIYYVGKNLVFQSKLHETDESTSSQDFGDWIYYKGQGFFSKSHSKIGQMIRPGLEVHASKISTFIKLNREELEGVLHFFTQFQPLTSRGLEVSVLTASSISVKPVYTSEVENLRFFGDFVFINGNGFYELPISMRLPEAYQEEVVIEGGAIHTFFSHDFQQLEKHILKLDPHLKIPHKADLRVDYLVRSPRGGLKTKLTLVTEFGQIPLTNLFEAIEKKGQYLFCEAGLIDLKDERFGWLRALKTPFDNELKTIEITTLDFLRLDATVGLLAHVGDAPQSQITNRLLKELREFTVSEPPNIKGLKSELRLYQQTGLAWLWFLYKNGLSALLCDDMGLGKTHQAMALMAGILAQKGESGRRFLVVCPTSVIYHWQDKLEMYLPDIKVHTFHGLKRSLSKLPKEGLILTTYGILRVEKEEIKKIPMELAIFDEIQVAKNPQSQVHDALTAVNASMRLGLTGTPIENSLRELKALFDIVLPGYMPPDTRFRTQFINPIEVDQDEEKKALLTQMIRPFIMRRRKSEVLQELPEKCEDKSFCDLSSSQVKLYKEILDQNRDALISDLRGTDSTVPYIHIFSLLSRLKQVCNHPALLAKDPDNFEQYDSGKWDLFVELLSEARESDQKVVVFSQYLHMLDIMENYLKAQKWGYAQIRGDTVDRRGELKRFQEDPNCVVFIGSLQAAGLGIDLTAASVVILYDRWWNAARENQAIDRVHRIGQKWGVHVFKLISKGTIEEKIDRMITRKGQLMEEIITSDDQAVLKKFTRSELIDLLTYVDNDEE